MHKSDTFLKYLSELNKINKKINKDFHLTPEMVYNELVYFNLDEREDIRHLFNRWVDRFKARPGIKVLKNNFYCQFMSGKINLNKALKIYISLNKKNIDENVTKIFEYLRSNNIEHISKVASSIRNDNLIIKVNNLEDVRKIQDFIVNENIIDDINEVMPFVLENEKIGLVKDNLYVYTYEISKIISECINKNIKLTSKVFANYLNQKRVYARDEDLKLIYKVCSLALTKDASFEKLNEISGENKISSKVLNEVLKKTKDKYGIVHTKKALLKYLIEGNLIYFTRGLDSKVNCRQNLDNKMNKEAALEIITGEVGNCKQIQKLVEKYVNLKFANEIAQAKEKKTKKENTIFSCCLQTYQKHGYDYALGALKAYKYGALDLFDATEKSKIELSALITKDEIEKVLKNMILESYPNMDENNLKVIEKKGLIETTIMNLVKGYADIQ